MPSPLDEKIISPDDYPVEEMKATVSGADETLKNARMVSDNRKLTRRLHYFFLNRGRPRLPVCRTATAVTMTDSVQIKCSRCKNVFRERARRLQNGYTRQCPSCEVVIFFDEDSQNPDVKAAMRHARRLRKELRELEAAAVFSSSAAGGAGSSRLQSHRSRSDARGSDDE